MPRGERGGASARRKRRREDRILVAGLLQGLQWFLTQACLNPVQTVEPVVHPTRAPARPSQSTSRPPTAAAQSSVPSHQNSASSRSAPVDTASDSEEEPQFVSEAAVQFERLRLLVPNPRNLSEGISVHRLDQIEGFYQVCCGSGYILVNSNSCSDVSAFVPRTPRFFDLRRLADFGHSRRLGEGRGAINFSTPTRTQRTSNKRGSRDSGRNFRVGYSDNFCDVRGT